MKESGESEVSDAAEMEGPQRTGGELTDGSQNGEVCDMSTPLSDEISKSSVQKSDNKDNTTTSGNAQSDQCLSQGASEGSITNQSTDSSIPSHVSPSEKLRESIPEMEVRKRRLQQFISMGGSTACSETHSDASSGIALEPTEVRNEQSCAQDKISATSDSSVGEEAYIPVVKTTETFSSSSSAADATSSLKEDGEDKRPPGSIRIRLKFLDETQRFVFALLTEQVGSFKRQHFSIEMDANRRIRLIFNGQLLSQDNSTLAQYGLFDNCVVHCHVSQPQQMNRGQSGELAAQEEEEAYVSGLLAPLLYCVMVVMWYLRYEYGHLFNTMSTVILLFLTALLLISTYLLYITQHVPDNGTSAQISARPQTETQSTL
ncbi:Transmembrane and ubiquitin-like domain-containing protein 1-like [Homarus americanus]|uniref:Transmembrane and ubiquitin-like domain-containing protein 1-like n=2 Tax=Homarus americanus TaxID=6706 RepID=A0A8J5TIE5_HOMAM|nr:Transmembrane and ubiquitin-like domain-containing protein 1-like [Homarus americanus]